MNTEVMLTAIVCFTLIVIVMILCITDTISSLRRDKIKYVEFSKIEDAYVLQCELYRDLLEINKCLEKHFEALERKNK